MEGNAEYFRCDIISDRRNLEVSLKKSLKIRMSESQALNLD